MPPKRRGRRLKGQNTTNDAEKKLFLEQVKVQYQGELAKVKALKDHKISMLHQVVALAKKRIPPEVGNTKKIDLKDTPAGTTLGKNFLITPKVNLNSPVAMLRYAQKGELAVSTSGSPLLVTGEAMTDTVNVNVPLNDGKVISLFANPKMKTKNIGNKLDPNIRQQLSVLTNTLKSILDKDCE